MSVFLTRRIHLRIVLVGCGSVFLFAISIAVAVLALSVSLRMQKQTRQLKREYAMKAVSAWACSAIIETVIQKIATFA